ncbi:Hypothetical protein ETEE_0266 [Edwardsiella anguillarum ET080813]|uniref:Uncharacterized protein n=1 Tax=Edwardsiella anguillarum ET080813 TaxID=667120 RepID=A0A076LEY8_9GAMM|nr:Hypothetical protein ETEE_0266 [Edwardsiella anguillarum ET080813]
MIVAGDTLFRRRRAPFPAVHSAIHSAMLCRNVHYQPQKSGQLSDSA